MRACKIRKRILVYRRHLNLAFNLAAARLRRADVSIFHEFSPSPSGGGHQFLRALWREFERRGLRVENNLISATTRACLFNSFNFDFDRLRYFKRTGCRMVHRVDGPIRVYRGWNDGSDQQIWQINQELADTTIFQSNYSFQKHVDLGLQFKSPQIIMNTVDPNIFHPQGRIEFNRRRKIRLITTSWSDNPNKGAETYKWLENYLDWNHFDFTFIGRSAIQFARIQMVAPAPSRQVADLLRQHDIFITASQYEACSNSLIEALACHLPALYINSGSNPEIVGEAGLSFSDQAEIPDLLGQLVDEYETRQAKIALPTLAETAQRYLAVMGVVTS